MRETEQAQAVPEQAQAEALRQAREEYDKFFARNAIDNMFKLFFTPELERRIARGDINVGFELVIAQAILRLDSPPIIRFNDEVRLEALIKAPRALGKGDPISLHEVGLFQAVELPRDELDCGHATVINTPLGAQLFFNFRYGRERAASFTDQAEEFLETAADALGRGRIKAALENLHTAAENIALAHLIVNTRPEAHGGTHKVIRSGINLWSRTGNIDPAFVKLYNWITQLREKVRYRPSVGVPAIPSNAFDLMRAEIIFLRRYWRWRDGHIDALTEKKPDLVLVKINETTRAVVLASN